MGDSSSSLWTLEIDESRSPLFEKLPVEAESSQPRRPQGMSQNLKRNEVCFLIAHPSKWLSSGPVILDDVFNIVACSVWFCFLSVKCMFSFVSKLHSLL